MIGNQGCQETKDACVCLCVSAREDTSYHQNFRTWHHVRVSATEGLTSKHQVCVSARKEKLMQQHLCVQVQEMIS